MELDKQREQFVVDTLDRWVLHNPSLKTRWDATPENAVELYKHVEFSQGIHAKVKEGALSSSVDSPAAKTARRRAEDAAIRIPQILDVLVPYLSESIVNEIYAATNPDTE